MAVSVFLALCVLGIAGAGFAELQLARHDLPALAERFASQAARLKALIVTEPQASQPTGSIQDKISSVPNGSESKDGRTARFSRSAHPVRKKRQPETSSAPNVLPLKVSSPVDLSAAEKLSLPAPKTSVEEGDDTKTRPAPTVLVRAGDTLSKIAKKLYGSFGTEDVRRLTAANPEIKDANVIYPGQTIRVQQATK
jgi:LysM repeat protein